MKIGAQLYTVRDFTQTENEFAQTIKKVADIGYTCVQVSGIGAIPVQKVADICNAQNIDIIITHTNPDRIKNETAAVINEHKLMNAKYIGIGSMPGYYENGCVDVKKFIADYKTAAERIHQAGLTFMYHNHDFEFEKRDGTLLIEQLAEAFPPEQMGFTLDTYWVQAGGGSPAAWLSKLKNRVDVIHIKDMIWRDGKIHMSEVMEGNLDWHGIIEAGVNSGVKYAMVEQDECYGVDPFECLKTSYLNWEGFLNG